MNWLRLKKEQTSIILTISFGNILEWFEIYSYAYLAPILARVFFNFETPLLNLLSSFAIFGSGFLTRPFGAIIFGRLGDLLGRKRAFILSITVMTIPTFLMGCLPTYSQWGIFAPLFLVALRLLQSIPAAGEVPGSICYLYENSDEKNKKFITSWAGVGNQIGAILGVVETFAMDQFMSDDFLMSWGWRISFWSGGVIGLFGIYLRSNLFETPQFEKLKKHHRLDRETIVEVISKYKGKIGIGVAFGVINAATFYFLATYVPTYFTKVLGLSDGKNIFISLLILVLTTVLLPVFGLIGDRLNVRVLMVSCASLIIALLYPLYISIESSNMFWISVIGLFYIIPITCISALLAYLLAHLFPTSVRFTGVGLAWNIADGIFGGFTPAIALLLLQNTANQAAFCWFILTCATVSLFAYFKIRE